MIKTANRKVAIAMASERGQRFGLSVIDGNFYVGSRDELRGAGVADIEGDSYVTTRCNFPHRTSDGKPIQHECDIIPPAALRAEMDGDTQGAIDLIESAKPLRHMRKGVRS